jgi:diaminohydroxyphosphoribosylaminopyrimidine deaminase / 5-amino-6-(5-phosphoribosylamino)uracil reductase
MVHMRHALRLAARALGRVAPNPAVGCVLIKDRRLVGRGWTQPSGRPHAETFALAAAGPEARGATAYVTLEPCAHYGKTPPCTEALIAAGVSRVVGAARDPDTRVNNAGFSALERAGIVVTTGVCEAEARALNAGFIARLTKGRPLVALKVAASADGFVAGSSGTDRWISGEAARRHAHLLRTKYDAILVGIKTVLADDPLLTCRLPGLEDRSPLRVVLDTRLRLPLASRLVRTAGDVPVLVFTAVDADGVALADRGIALERVGQDRDGRLFIPEVLNVLARRGVTRVLVEGGPGIHAAFLGLGDLVDEIHVYRAPVTLGAGLHSAIHLPDDAFHLVWRQPLPPDVLESYAATV